MERLELKKIKELQRGEITEHEVYKKLAHLHNGEERKILLQLAEEEKKHYDFFKKYSRSHVEADWLMVKRVCILTKIFGLTFGLKSMERWEEEVQKEYKEIQFSFVF